MAEQDSALKELDIVIAKSTHARAAKNAIGLLFPRLSSSFGTHVPSTYNNISQRRGRLSNSDFSGSYFAFDPARAGWGRSEVDELFSKTPSEVFSHVEERIELNPVADSRARLRRLFLDLLAQKFREGLTFDSQWALATANASRYYIENQDVATTSLFPEDNSTRLFRALWRGLESLSSSQQEEVFLYAVETAQDLTLLCDTFRGLVGDLVPDGAKPNDRAFGARHVEIRQHLLTRVKGLAEQNILWKQAKPTSLLWFWRGCDEESAVRQYVNASTEDRKNLIIFLQEVPSIVYSSAGNYFQVDPNTWEKIADLSLIKDRAEDLKKAASQEELEIVSRYLKATQNTIYSQRPELN